MTEEINQPYPQFYNEIDAATKESGFTMASDVLTCSLLRTLAATKPGGKFLELGTGTGLSTAWILEGMDQSSTLVSIDNEAKFLEIADQFLGADKRLTLVETDGAAWVEANINEKYDYIFADTWHGKYLLLDEVLDMLNPGGLYIIDDMLPQPNWPEGHDQKAINLVKYLDSRADLFLTKQVWATGIIVGVKR
ncbi:O-methyltransferase [Dyadobacter sp. CY312]|uniref:O-methyltransferase n=1 Tax=Dyadobacter sp. CY312 TaxID=2907303 RepID=UPI001F2F2D09|nr:class I SAM-dependent methyltransferase [Dyadobacter sp. CY312]MCE7040218.1 class I SAM-dependent methyltransferase [Dyadobacter sp. CY312]